MTSAYSVCVFSLVSRAVTGVSARITAWRPESQSQDEANDRLIERSCPVVKQEPMWTKSRAWPLCFIHQSVCVCSAVQQSVLQPRKRWETRQERIEDSASRFAPRCSLTSALWHVAVLNCAAIIWCQVAQRPQTSVILLLCCIVCVRISSTHVFPARTRASRDSLH